MYRTTGYDDRGFLMQSWDSESLSSSYGTAYRLLDWCERAEIWASNGDDWRMVEVLHKPAAQAASHSDLDILSRPESEPAYSDEYRRACEDNAPMPGGNPAPCDQHTRLRHVVTSSGLQTLLPGQEPAPVQKGAAYQGTMF